VPRDSRPTTGVRRFLTPPQLAKIWGVSTDKVYALIWNGSLRALNLAARLGGQPRYRISLEAVREFELSRTVVPTPRPSRRAKVKEENFVEYY
jgi:excisionase family DNA binding protein